MNSGDVQEQPADPELDQFMEIYCHMLVRYRQELTRPIQEADEFFRSMEAQMDTLSLDDNGYEGGGSSDDDEQEPVDLVGLPVAETTGSPSAEDKELKTRLLNKYSGYLSSLWKELSRKKKKGKLPRDARQKLLHWWQLHYRWPYPSELERRRWRSRRGWTRSRSTTGSSTSGSGTGSRRRRRWCWPRTTGCARTAAAAAPRAVRAPPLSAWRGSTSPAGARIRVAPDRCRRPCSREVDMHAWIDSCVVAVHAYIHVVWI